MLKFYYDAEKAVALVRWFISREGGNIDLLKLIKLIYFADKLHFVRYGQPISGGMYFAMDNGPVHSEIYDTVKDNDSLFLRRDNSIHCLNDSPVDKDEFSYTENVILDEVYEKYGKKTGLKLVGIAHKEHGWIKNKPLKKGTRNPYPYEDFPDIDDAEAQEMVDDNIDIQSILRV